MPTDATHENPHRLTPPGLGSPQTGLRGPFLFPFRWTFQRRGGRRSWRRRAHRALEAHLVPLFIEAVPPPVKALRDLLFHLAEGVRIHHELDLGEAFFTVFPPFGSSETEVVVDFLPVERIQTIGRDGSRMLLSRMARHFLGRWEILQRRALQSGGYFPPPALLRARVSRDGAVRMEVGFAAGFVPQNRLLTLQHTTQKGARRALWLLDANEPVPTGRRGAIRDAFRVACADRYAQPGETVLHIGNPTSWGVKARFDLALREGDELHPACPWPDDPSGWHAKGETWALYWHGHSLGRIHLLDKALRAALAGAVPFVMRIVRLGAGMRSDRDGLIFAIYRTTEHVDG